MTEMQALLKINSAVQKYLRKKAETQLQTLKPSSEQSEIKNIIKEVESTNTNNPADNDQENKVFP